MNKDNFLKIGNRLVGYSYDPLIIAEIGINHNGSLEVAIEMAKAAIDAGAEIIKHQTHIVEDEMSEMAKEAIPGNAKESIYDIMDRCSLNEEEEYKLMKYVQDRGAIFISTAFSRAAADRLRKFDIPAYKIGSGECNNYPLIEYIARFGKPMIISTGMNDIKSVHKTVNIIRKHNVPYALLHTTNLYPTPNELVRLGAINELAESFEDAVVGLSDHTTDNLACFGAVALGASLLERHFTDSMDREGPDIICSMTPNSLKELIRGSKVLKLQRGGSKEKLLDEEEVTRRFAFSTIVTIREIEKGEVLNSKNIWVKRPGIGEIKAEHYEEIMGKKVKRKLKIGEHLSWNDFS